MAASRATKARQGKESATVYDPGDSIRFFLLQLRAKMLA